MITRDNYEAYFVDYLEGNLPEDQIDQFLDFLNQNTDLKEELHLFEEVVLPHDNVVFSEKQVLRKTAEDEKHRFENKAIAYMEGDLDESERNSLESYLATQPKLRKEFDLFTKTRLTPDMSIHFDAKNKLYRKPVKTIVLNWVARAAAVVVLVWGINSLFETTEKTEIAQNKTESATQSTTTSTESGLKTDAYPKTVIQEKEKMPETSKPEVIQSKREPVQTKIEEIPVITEQTEEPPIQLAQLQPIDARIETEQELYLAVPQTNNITPINESPRIMSAEEFLAMRAKKIGKEGLFSAQRIARLGLNIASEISGERIGYKEKDGKITSVEFESKLMAFSIPLEKK
jgi:hypothetical protein